jgi:ComF family protein
MKKLQFYDYWDSFVCLFFPRLCVGCLSNLPPTKEELCVGCEFRIPRTKFHFEKYNKFTDRFASRIPLETGAAYYLFTKGGHTQSLIHQIKYNGRKEFAQKIGQNYGKRLMESPLYQSIDVIIPVPMHPMKERERGYNQADFFAAGLSDGMGKPFLKKGLLKVEQTVSQTRKSRVGRFANVEEVFQLGNEDLEGKHILLVDDVLTTGATLEACANQLLAVPNVKISMATIAFANGY